MWKPIDFEHILKWEKKEFYTALFSNQSGDKLRCLQELQTNFFFCNFPMCVCWYHLCLQDFYLSFMWQWISKLKHVSKITCQHQNCLYPNLYSINLDSFAIIIKPRPFPSFYNTRLLCVQHGEKETDFKNNFCQFYTETPNSPFAFKHKKISLRLTY